jgi:hypothetical protein
MHQRTKLAKVTGLISSYKDKKGNYIPIEKLGDATQVTPDMLIAVLALDREVKDNQGTLLITELWRSWDTQAQAYKAKPKLANPPGKSFHQAGVAVDIDTKNLNFIGVPKDQWLEKFWELSKPLGFHPVISRPDLSIAENWHFQLYGKDWEAASLKIMMSELAKCCILDVGMWTPSEDKEKVKRMFIQSQLIRLGHYEISTVDGIFGPKTNGVLEFMGLKDMDTATVADILSKRVI